MRKVLAGKQARLDVAFQQKQQVTSRQPVEGIVELTGNNLVLFLKKLECSSQLGCVSVVKPYITLVGEVCKSNTLLLL